MPPENNSLPVMPEPVVAAPTLIPTVAQKQSSPWAGIFGVSLILVTLLAGYFYSQIPKDEEKNETPTPTVTASVMVTTVPTTIIATLPVTTSVTPTPTVVAGKATISGTLGYPSESVPAMSVCAVDSTTKKETCVKTKLNQDKYQLSVNAGSYIVYAKAMFPGVSNNVRAYYTKCDTYKDSFIPECNSNAGNVANWDADTFKCYEDPTCKAAFTPLTVTVKAGEKKTLSTILQGWYIPCSYDGKTCNSDSFDVWQDFLK